MKKYLRLYYCLLRLNVSRYMAYRGNFVSSAVTSLMWAVFSVISILLLTSRNPMVFGWNRDELLVLTGVYSMVIGLFHVLFTRNLEQMSRIVHRGQLDGILTKPVDPQFYLSCAIVNYSSLPRVVSATVFVIWLLWKLQIFLTFVAIFQFVFLGLIGLVFLYAAWYSILTITIWQSNLSNLSDLLFHVTDAAKYPSDMYNEFRYYVTLFLLPLSLIITLPTKALFQRTNILEIIALMVFALCALIVSRISGKYVLRSYTSASS